MKISLRNLSKVAVIMCMSRNGRMASDLSRAVPVERDIEQDLVKRSGTELLCVLLRDPKLS
ncbi:hypothetical protein Bca4012_018969 [Brassica carinata]